MPLASLFFNERPEPEHVVRDIRSLHPRRSLRLIPFMGVDHSPKGAEPFHVHCHETTQHDQPDEDAAPPVSYGEPVAYLRSLQWQESLYSAGGLHKAHHLRNEQTPVLLEPIHDLTSKGPVSARISPDACIMSLG